VEPVEPEPVEPVESVHHEVTDGWIPWMDVSYGHWTLVVVEPMPYIHTYRWLIYIYIYIYGFMGFQ